MRRVCLVCLLLPLSSLFATLVGNPAQPALFKSGLIIQRSFPVSFRAGYVDDWVYQQRFQDEFKLEGVSHTRTFMKLSTYASLLTLSFTERLDLYGLVGSSRMQIDEEIFTKRACSWGTGLRLIALKSGNFYFGTNFTYFETNQKPRYFLVEGLPYNIVSNFRLQYSEIQAAAGIAYKIYSVCVPYINATYLMAKVEPKPLVVLVRLPDVDERVDVTSKSVINKKRWGMALGLTLVDEQRFTLAVEWRAFNQNAIDWNFDFRF